MAAHNKNQYKKGRSMDFMHLFLKYFFESEYMHFGYWEPSQVPKFMNLKQAKQQYVDKLFTLIPNGIKNILDIGCGSGAMACHLIQKGYQVDAVAPPCIMTGEATNKIMALDPSAVVYPLKFEDLNVTKNYDLLMLSESFQFINLEAAFIRFSEFSPRYVLIADVCKNDLANKERGPIGGGHSYQKFLEYVKNSSLEIVSNIDVTSCISPHFDLEQDVMQNFVKKLLPIMQRARETTQSYLLRGVIAIILKLTQTNLEKIRKKYLDNPDRNGNTFKQYKCYRFILLLNNRAGNILR